MKHFKYLIIGGGLTGDAAVKGIREIDKEGSIAMFSVESDPPYVRPALSKGLWKGKSEEKIWRKTEDQGVEMHLNDRITSLDTEKKIVTDEKGTQYSYDKLLLATGCDPVKLPFGKEFIIYYRNYQDYRHLRELADKGEKFLVIGGGFIGSEITAALTMNDKKVVMIFLEDTIGAKIYPPDLGEYLNVYYKEHGVEVLADDAISKIEPTGDKYHVETRSGKKFAVDGVVAGIGVRPSVELAEKAGLKIDNGIVVDDYLQTSHPDIYSAGDVANFFHTQLKKRVRVEHEDNAIASGKTAGRNMAGAGEAYTHIPQFYSDIFDLGYEAVGELNSKMETVVDWAEPYKKGVIYYLDEGKPKGILLWNVWDAIPAARDILKEADTLEKKDLTLGLVKEKMAKN